MFKVLIGCWEAFSSITAGQRGESSDSDTQDQREVSWRVSYVCRHCVSISLQGHIRGGKQTFSLLVNVFRQRSEAGAAQRQLPCPRYALHLEPMWRGHGRQFNRWDASWQKKPHITCFCIVICKNCLHSPGAPEPVAQWGCSTFPREKEYRLSSLKEKRARYKKTELRKWDVKDLCMQWELCDFTYVSFWP